MPKNETEDEILMRRLADAEPEALRKLYRKYGSLAYGIALRIVGDEALAEDIALDVFMSAWQASSSYSPDRGAAATWLGRIARNRAIDALRKVKSRGALARDDWADIEDRKGLDPEAEASRASCADEVRAGVAELPEAQRIALSLAFFRGRTHAEIAAALALPLGTVKSRIRDAMLALREKLGESCA
jgi:RNA polymerase sigma-70 factor, ECF subfamily